MNAVCLSENVLSHVAIGLLPEPALSLALIHIDECEICQERIFEAIKQSDHRITQTPSIDDSPDIHGKLELLNRYRAEIITENTQVLEERSYFGPFQIIRLIHSGLMSQVYEAFDPRLKRQIVLKILAESFVKSEPASANRFLEEARIVAQMKNPHIVMIYDVGIDENRPFIVMPKLEGESLRSRLKQGPIALEETIQLVQMLIKGLKAAHHLGVIHRDLKPENLWLEPDENGRDHLVILDFGIAQFITEPSQGISGTPSYWSPEQVLNLRVDERTDFFAVGCLIFEMVTGRKAWASDVADEFRNPLLDSNLPKILIPILSRLMTLEVGQRYDDHESILNDLNKAKESVIVSKSARFGSLFQMTIGSMVVLLFLVLLFGENTHLKELILSSFQTNVMQRNVNGKASSVIPIRFEVDKTLLQLQPGSPIAVSANGLLLAKGIGESSYSLYDVKRNNQRINRLLNSEISESVRLSESGRFAAALHNDNSENGYLLKVWKIDPDHPHKEVQPIWSSLFRERKVYDFCLQEFDGKVFLVLSMDLKQIQVFEFGTSINEAPKLSRLNYQFSFVTNFYPKPGDSLLLAAKFGGGVDIFDLRSLTLKFSYRMFENGPPVVDWNPNGYGLMGMDLEGKGIDYDLRVNVEKVKLGHPYLIPDKDFRIDIKPLKVLFLGQDYYAVLSQKPNDGIVLYREGSSIQITSIEFINNRATDMFVIADEVLGVIDIKGIFRKFKLEKQTRVKSREF